MNKKGILVNAIIMFFFVGFVSSQTSAPANNVFHKNIGVDEFSTIVDSVEGTLLDVRTENEFASGHLDGAKNVVYSMFGFENNLADLDKNEVYFIYCRSGARSGRALKVMKSQGFKKVYNLNGGILGWKRNGKKVVQ